MNAPLPVPSASVSPLVDEESASHWAALSDRRLVLQRCEACRRCRFPPLPACPYCGHLGSEVLEATGAGRVYSWVRVHRALHQERQGEVPYVVVVVELVEGPRLAARLEGDGPVVMGMAVEGAFVDHDTWTELRFTPVSQGHPHPPAALPEDRHAGCRSAQGPQSTRTSTGTRDQGAGRATSRTGYGGRR